MCVAAPWECHSSYKCPANDGWFVLGFKDQGYMKLALLAQSWHYNHDKVILCHSKARASRWMPLTESTTNAWVVLVLNNNIYVIDLMNIDDRFQKRSIIGMVMTNGCGPLKMSRSRIGYPKTLHFWFSDPRSL